MRKQLLGQLGKLVLDDFSISDRLGKGPAVIDAMRIAGDCVQSAEGLRTVYTAFDGDHFQLCAHMRRHVLACGNVPANPESVLGYKNTVDARRAKKHVLIDDLTILRGCDQLWIYTDEPAELSSLASLAEGVLAELLFFLKRRDQPEVRFVNLKDVLCGASVPRTTRFEWTYEESVTALPADASAVLSLANSGFSVDKQLVSLQYYISDPLDFKYGEWLRVHGYLSQGGVRCAPLVPWLAVEPIDAGPSIDGLGLALLSWVKLITLAGGCVYMPAMESARSSSSVAALLRAAWGLLRPDVSPTEHDWLDMKVPKVLLREKWPITRREGGVT